MDVMDEAISSDDNPLQGSGKASGGGTTEERLSLLEAQLVELRSSPGGDERNSTLGGAMARLSQAPTAWHQAAVYFLADGDARGPRMVAMGFVMVLLQTCAAFGIMMSTIEQSCHTSEICQIRGTWCATTSKGGKCIYCGDDLPLPLEGARWEKTCAGCRSLRPVLNPDNTDGITYNHPDVTATPGVIFGGYNTSTVEDVCSHTWAGTRGVARVGISGITVETLYGPEDVHAWCSECVEPLTHEVRGVTFISTVVSNARSMSGLDWCSMVLSGYVVALAVVGELKDIKLIEISLDEAGNAISPVWHRALGALSFARRWVFLSAFGWIVPNLVLKLGGNALNICFNTIAVAFLAEIDQLAYHFALNEALRERVEARTRVKLSDKHIQSFVDMRTAHVPMVMLFILTSLLLGRLGSCDGAACDSTANMWGSIATLMFPLEPLCATMLEHVLVGDILSRAAALSCAKGITGFVLTFVILFTMA